MRFKIFRAQVLFRYFDQGHRMYTLQYQDHGFECHLIAREPRLHRCSVKKLITTVTIDQDIDTEADANKIYRQDLLQQNVRFIDYTRRNESPLEV